MTSIATRNTVLRSIVRGVEVSVHSDNAWTYVTADSADEARVAAILRAFAYRPQVTRIRGRAVFAVPAEQIA